MTVNYLNRKLAEYITKKRLQKLDALLLERFVEFVNQEALAKRDRLRKGL